MIPQSLILDCLKMYKIPTEVIQFIEKTMETWIVKLTAGGKSLTEVKIQKRILQGDALSPFWLNKQLCHSTKFSENAKLDTSLVNRKKNINHSMYIDDIKLFAKNKREMETQIQTVKIYNQYIECNLA